MRRHLVLFLMTAVAISAYAEFASAVVFRRARQQRFTEMRLQITGELQSQMRQEVAAVANELEHDADENFQVIAVRLEEGAKDEVAEMREQAAKMIADETVKLEQQIIVALDNLREEAAAKLAQEAKRLEAVVQTESQKLKEAATADVKKMNDEVQLVLRAALDKLASSSSDVPAPTSGEEKPQEQATLTGPVEVKEEESNQGEDG